MSETPTDKLISSSQRNQRRFGAIIAALFLFQFGLSMWYYTTATFVKGVDISITQPTAPILLCPGDILTYDYTITAKGSGVLVKDFTVWRETPPKTMVFSTLPRRFILGGEVEQHLTESWEVPGRYFNFEDWEEEPIPPGNYSRFYSISSPTNTRLIDIDSIQFTIKEPHLCKT